MLAHWREVLEEIPAAEMRWSGGKGTKTHLSHGYIVFPIFSHSFITHTVGRERNQYLQWKKVLNFQGQMQGTDTRNKGSKEHF